MPWKRLVNSALRRTVGYELSHPPGHPSWRISAPRGGRLLVAPVFILSAARSGSTLARAILDSHSRLYAPPELPLKHLGVRADTRWIQASMDALRLTEEDLNRMLWDHVLADLLARTGKPTIVVKTPSNVLIWEDIASCWPDARFIFLLRHPGAAVASLRASFDPQWHRGESGTLEEAVAKALRYMTKVEEARRALPGLTVHYEKLTSDPGAEVRRMCSFLGLPFEAAMLDYGRFAHGPFVPGLGDASDKIRSGRIQPTPSPAPGEAPPAFRDICLAWGYPVPGAEPDHGEASARTVAGTGPLASEPALADPCPPERASPRSGMPGPAQAR